MKKNIIIGITALLCVPVSGEENMKDKLIEVREIKMFMKDGANLLSYAPAYQRLLESLSAPEYMDYSFVMAVSGAATRLAWQPGWAGHSNQAQTWVNDGDLLTEYRRGFAGAGVVAEFRLNAAQKAWWQGKFSGDVAWADAEKARAEIAASLDNGVPVLAYGMTGDAASLVVGYEENGARLRVVCLHTPGEKRQGASGYETTSEKWTEEFKMYCLVKKFAPRAVDETLLRDVMRQVVSLARATDYKNCALGMNAQQSLAEHLVWDEGFANLVDVNKQYEGALSWPYERPEGYWNESMARSLGERIGAGYCDFLCMQNGFGNLAAFLEKHKDVMPEHAAEIGEAIRCARVIEGFTGALWKHVSPDDAGVAKFKDDDIRSIFASHMLRSKMYHLRMVEIFERVLTEGK